MLKPHTIPLNYLVWGVCALGLGQFITGTPLVYIGPAMVAFFFAVLTYNTLGGLSRFSGIIFANFALRNIIVSQIAKVILFEPAQRNLEAAILTINIYAVFYICTFLAACIASRIRIRMPQPLILRDIHEKKYFFWFAFIIGSIATFVYNLTAGGYTVREQATRTESIALGLSPLLLLSLVIAVDLRLRTTRGRHSVSFKTVISAAVLEIFAVINSMRSITAMPVIAYTIKCYLSGFKFKFRHYVVGGALVVVFMALVSPFQLIARRSASLPNLWDRAHAVYNLFLGLHNPTELALTYESMRASESGSYREKYFDSENMLLNRFALIRADSALISACSQGYHYGFEAIKIDFSNAMPSFLSKNKEAYPSANFLGHVSGIAPEGDSVVQIAVTVIADSYGAFGWMGVILVPLIGFTTTFILYDGMFPDLSTEWATVALAMLLQTFGEILVGRFILVLIRIPLQLLFTSYMLGFFVKLLALRGENRAPVRAPIEQKISS